MNAVELLDQLHQAGISLRLVDGKLRVKGNRHALTSELQAELIACKDELLQLLRTAEGDNEPLLPQPRGNDFPLSWGQRRLWFLDELEPGTAIYNMPFAMEVQGKLDRPALQRALDRMIERHESLRTVFVVINGEPRQHIEEQLQVIIGHETAQDTTTSGVRKRARAVAQAGFDLATGPLLRLQLFETQPERYLFLLVMHHIISDLWSLQRFFHELGALYASEVGQPTTPLPELPVQYADFAVWQRANLQGNRLRPLLDYWRRTLEDAPPILELPLDFPRPREPGYRGSWLARPLNSSLLQQIDTFSAQYACTPFMVTLAAFAGLLHRYSDSNDLVIGSPVSGRQRSELEPLIGFFLNTLPLRISLADSPDCIELLARTRRGSIAAYAHQELPFELLVEELQPERSLSHTPVFQHMFIWQDNRGSRLQLAGLDVLPATLISHDTAKFDLTLALTRTENGLEAGFEYNTELFSHKTVERLLMHYETVLSTMLAQPDTPISRLSWLGAAERCQVLDSFNATTADFGLPASVHQLVETQAALTPDAVALEFGEQSLSYSELNARANALAVVLQEHSAGPGKIIGICCRRSPQLAIAALAVLKSGACYLALDPDFPATRIASMLADSQALMVLANTGLDLLPPGTPAFDLSKFDAQQAANLPPVSGLNDPAYCIYTSGSTGVPKGSQLSHAGLANLLCWQQNHDRLGRAARTLQFASFSFDVSFQELFGSWTTGGTVILVDSELRQDLPRLARFIQRRGIERLYLPFAALQPLAESLLAETTQLPPLLDIIVAGEQLQVTPEVRRLFTHLPEAALHNQYGPSETHVVTACTLSGNPTDWPPLPPIGKPVANTRCYVLDELQQPQPVGVPGELWIGGPQVALGYLRRDQLNAEKFQPSPFVAGDRLYRTGDRVRWLANGCLEFLGRKDTQLKWRGYRIEPGEIETALLAHDSVNQAAVLVHVDADGRSQLIAYIVATPGTAPDSAALRRFISQRLPEYMLPSRIILLETMPLTPSGKVARRRLPPPEPLETAGEWVAPASPTEQKLADIWSEVLGTPRVGAHDDFFLLGGHSLLATRVVARIRENFSVALPLKYLFRHPTPAALASALDTLLNASDLTKRADGSAREEFII